MKASELKNRLEEMIKQFGDKEVRIPAKAEDDGECDPDDFVEIVSVGACMKDEETAESFDILDSSWHDAFSSCDYDDSSDADSTVI